MVKQAILHKTEYIMSEGRFNKEEQGRGGWWEAGGGGGGEGYEV